MPLICCAFRPVYLEPAEEAAFIFLWPVKATFGVMSVYLINSSDDHIIGHPGPPPWLPRRANLWQQIGGCGRPPLDEQTAAFGRSGGYPKRRTLGATSHSRNSDGNGSYHA